MNTARFLEKPERYFDGSYQQFVAFGGPCIYFHGECLKAGANDFLSDRHLELLYATLTAWGMHRMGEGKTKLMPWHELSTSLREHKALLATLRTHRMMDLSEAQYAQAIDDLKIAYCAMRVSISDASIVANSKALLHILPELIPPIDRQYTWRFFHHKPDQWKHDSGTYRKVNLPKGLECQFGAFRDICLRVKQLADATGKVIRQAERQRYGVVPPEAVDNAIVNYIRLHGLAETPGK